MRLSLLGQDGAETGLSFSSPTVPRLRSGDLQDLACYLGGPVQKRLSAKRHAASFFNEADLAPPGGLPPPNGWGEGNDSPCQTCACTETHGDGASAEEPGVGEDAYPKMVFPNVPHHSFYPHRRGYRISHARIFGLFFAGLGCGYAAANSATQKQKQELGEDEELAGSAAEGA
ncbi:Putative fumarate reductase [Durusdinium trenchii]|uniref:Fumarate reductase n=1 Tax=Durusdinium trenchii TaxID=1381693 RepID=A0ABP0NT70_9DINO